MSRMGEWAAEHEDDEDLMLAALAHEEKLHEQWIREQELCQLGLITPLSFQLSNSPQTNSSTPGQVTVMTSTGSWLPKKV
jgi:hypothetical protein